MPKDTLLNQKYFDSFNSDEELKILLSKEKIELEELINTIYANESPIYYNGPQYSYSILRKDPDFSKIKTQLYQLIDKLKFWGQRHELPEHRSLDDFKNKLDNPSDRITVLYNDGKKALEIITVLLDDSSFNLDLRKSAYIDLLADNALAKCIDGCFTRLSNTAEILQTYQKNNHYINRMIRLYATDTAKKLAASRPFASADTYQVNLCRMLNITEEANELHVNNYLLAKAKERQIPVEVFFDHTSLEIAEKIKQQHLEEHVNRYLHALEEKLTASRIVNYIAEQLHSEFKDIINNSVSKEAAINNIESLLDLIGQDPDFSFTEIIDSDLSEAFDTLPLYAPNKIAITVERRLTESKFLMPVEKKTLKTSDKSYSFYNFKDNLDLGLIIDEESLERYHFFDLFEFPIIIQNAEQLYQHFIPHFINTANDLLIFWEKKNVTLKSKNLSIFSIINSEKISNLLNSNDNVLVLLKIFEKLTLNQSLIIFKKLTSQTIKTYLLKGFNLAKQLIIDKNKNIHSQNKLAISEALGVTKELIQLFIQHDHKDFAKIIFPALEIDYLDNLDLSFCNLSKSRFFQPLISVKFDRAILDEVYFYKNLEKVSFNYVDLSKTNFEHSIQNAPAISLTGAILTDKVFLQLLDIGIRNFQSSDLRQVDLKKHLPQTFELDLSNCNLEGVDISGMALKNVVFHGSNLKDSYLQSTSFNIKNLDENTKINGAKLNIHDLEIFNRAGVSDFSYCHIFQKADSTHTIINRLENKILIVENAKFTASHFFGDLLDAKFIHCEFDKTTFSANADYLRDGYFSNINFEKSHFNHVEFDTLQIVDTSFIDCKFNNIKFSNVELEAKVLFKFYQQGQLDFNGINKLQGKLPNDLSQFPLENAVLPEKVFTYLLDNGVRDFRFCNLSGIKLGVILKERRVSEIELKLTGASYLKRILSCPHLKFKRQLITTEKKDCSYIFLLQHDIKENYLTNDLKAIFDKETSENIFIQKVSLEHSPLNKVAGGNQIQIYWNYIPNDIKIELEQTFNFLVESTEFNDRIKQNVQLFIPKSIVNKQLLVKMGVKLQNKGFSQGFLHYFNQAYQFVTLDFKGNFVQSSISNILSDIEIEKAEMAIKDKKAKNRAKLFKFLEKINHPATIATLKSAMHQGKHYELGFFLMHWIAVWALSSGWQDHVVLSEEKKTQLKNYARNVIDEIREESPEVSEYMLNLAFCFKTAETAITLAVLHRGKRSLAR